MITKISTLLRDSSDTPEVRQFSNIVSWYEDKKISSWEEFSRIVLQAKKQKCEVYAVSEEGFVYSGRFTTRDMIVNKVYPMKNKGTPYFTSTTALEIVRVEQLPDLVRILHVEYQKK